MKRLAAALALILATPAAADDSWSDAGVVPCDDRAYADFIAEPWDQNSRVFANGEVRVALMDFVEPAAAAYYLMILSPPYDEIGMRQCRLVGMAGDFGFGSLDFDALEAGYDPATGLTLTLPAKMPMPDGGDDGLFQLAVRLDQKTGKIVTQGMK
ncbi:hypothetical protein JJJ17_11490 [Paracoccus caeni]|uniref:Uncharacterized protein n=1 Tax=Paracoccus caeni TaxID=657651 RepID=A0A934SFN3_9RHOB|nr:hypothetical protein [Paracoccus caeni]MBK4216550.1 hypothetical protein [Paracoccus caeni]